MEGPVSSIKLHQTAVAPDLAISLSTFDKRLTRRTTSSVSSGSCLDSIDSTRTRDVAGDEMKSSIPPAPLSIDEDERLATSARIHSVQSASNVLALASRTRSKDNLLASVPIRRYNSSTAMVHASLERKRSLGHSTAPARVVKGNSGDVRTGFARIYFENNTFTSSTVFKLVSTTTVLEVRQSMAAKIKIPMQEFHNYAVVVVFPTESTGSPLSARTLRDDELILPLVEKLNRARLGQSIEVEQTATNNTRSKSKYRAGSPVKFVLKEISGSQLSGSERTTPSRRPGPRETQSLTFPVLLGKGVFSGYLQKASAKDPSLWRKRWFIIKGDQLLYCKSNANQQDVTSVSLLGAVLAKAKPEVRMPFSFQLKTPRQDYELCAGNKDEMVAWIHALHVQIGLCSENHRLYEAEIWITEDAVNQSEQEAVGYPATEPSLLERVLSREDTLKLFRDFVFTSPFHTLLDTWIECELFRRSCLARENGLVTSAGMIKYRTAQDEWNHLKAITGAIHLLQTIQDDELNGLLASCQAEYESRRVGLAANGDEPEEYPRTDVIVPVQRKLFKAIEAGPFQHFLLQNGYQLLIERIIGAIA
ncbi:hypothetical protein CCR75_008164 [Bremia lactucae]|uniref:Uncharacterized protein n=1 Tax=Bremia lactucae TaxID=4779 RepID=A0A976IDQ5_BRELC|nr:hypothetical protein CCR75_008164 [Bremia lactucae]